MVQSPSWEAKGFSASQEIPRTLWNSKVHYLIHNSQPLMDRKVEANKADTNERAVNQQQVSVMLLYKLTASKCNVTVQINSK